MTVKPFKLTVADRAATGVAVKPDKLVLRPTSPAIAAGVAMTIVGGGLVLLAVLGAGAPGVLGLIGLAIAVPGWRSATARVIADQDGLQVRNHWKTSRLRWTAVQSISVRQCRRRWGRVLRLLTPDLLHEFLIGVVTLVDGSSVACDALSSVAQQGEDPSNEAARVKVAILNRWASEQGLLD